MEKSKLIKFLLSLESGFTPNERKKALEDFDEVYIDEKIKEHSKKARRQRGLVIILVVTLIVSIGLVFGSSWINPELTLWLKGGIAGLFAGMVFMVPYSFRHHRSLVVILKTVREIMRTESKGKEKEKGNKDEESKEESQQNKT